MRMRSCVLTAVVHTSPPVNGLQTQNGYHGHRDLGSGRRRHHRCRAVGAPVRLAFHAGGYVRVSSGDYRASRSDRVSNHRDAACHERSPGQPFPTVHRAVPPVRARLRHDHGIDAVRDRQRLSVHQGSAHHQWFQVRWPAQLFPLQRTVCWRSKQL